MADTSVIELDKLVKKSKRTLEPFREIILFLNSILIWEKQWYPIAISVANTIFFLLLWIWDPSVLTAISSLAILVIVIDYFSLTISSFINQPNHWNGAKEKTFDSICRNIASFQINIRKLVVSWQNMKVAKPKCYYIGSVVILFIIFWVGNVIHNLLLTYFFFTVTLLMPGLGHQGILSKYGCSIVKPICDTFQKIGITEEKKIKDN